MDINLEHITDIAFRAMITNRSMLSLRPVFRPQEGFIIEDGEIDIFIDETGEILSLTVKYEYEVRPEATMIVKILDIDFLIEGEEVFVPLYRVIQIHRILIDNFTDEDFNYGDYEKEQMDIDRELDQLI